MRRSQALAGTLTLLALAAPPNAAGQTPGPPIPAALTQLAERFWSWRAGTQPLSGDDIPRIPRSAEWLPDWSPGAVVAQRKAVAGFAGAWKAIDTTGWSIPARVDYRLMGAAVERVRWELEVTRLWRRDPAFYLDQTVGSLFDALLSPGPFDPERTHRIVRRVERIPITLREGKANLTEAVGPFAALAVESVSEIRPQLDTVRRELAPLLQGPDAARFAPAMEAAAAALEQYRDWLRQRLPALPVRTAVGREAYVGFLRRIAMVPWSPEQLVAMARQDFERAVSFETYERNRNSNLPELSIFPSAAAQEARADSDEARVRRFLVEHRILSVPDWLHHYRTPPIPSYLAPIASWGVDDDLTSETRLDQDGVSYRPHPSAKLPYFSLATAKDPRPLLVHEGIPGHYMQLTLSWANPDPIRRRYYDSNANEGIGFYAEEMMLQAGFFDDSPRTREIIYNFMRLRALRVEVDVKLALGEFSLEQAARYLEQTVPMDRETALGEAASFAARPGQAITYEIGKLQILQFLADARLREGDRFSLQAFHDNLWKNGNVPISLVRWEYLGGQ
ncbi:MAG: DUF885 family protein [Gemmatimonadales bacterium]